jgi:DNA-binding MarR family transcriptional regulator
MSIKRNSTNPFPADDDAVQTKRKMPLGFLMGMTANDLNRQVDGSLAPWKITGSQWGVCRMIQEGLGTTASALCRHYGYDSGALARILQALEKKGLILRERSADDQRRVDLKVTDQGRQLIAETLPQIRLVGEQMLQGFSDEEVELFKDFLIRAHVQLANLADSGDLNSE